MIRLLVTLELITLLVLGIVGLHLLSDQTKSLQKIASTAIVAGPQGPPGINGARGATGPKGASAFPYAVAINHRICTVTNLWREGTLAGYEDRLLTYRATPAPFFCKA